MPADRDRAGLDFELVLVDDGSGDGSFEEIKRLAGLEPRVRGFRLSRNFGHQAALTVGLRESRGAFVAIIDDDLQDPPELLPVFFERLYDEVDVVYGLRRRRKESWLRRIFYSGFYRTLNLLSEIDIPLDSGDFCAMRRSVVEAMLQLKEAHPFLRGTRSWVGFRQLGLEYERQARFQGRSGYTLIKYLSLALTGILSTSRLPLRFATLAGLATALGGLIFAAYALIGKLAGSYDVPGYASIIIAVVLLGAVQLISLGLIGEYLARIFDEVRKWPVAFVAEKTQERKR
ncbi:MAG: glycosyltransferase family 2 protein [Deltaproteobacteria bacterium]|nr:glycosyltransferase family 2 protein [Deltaproteobacteria bacterium]